MIEGYPFFTGGRASLIANQMTPFPSITNVAVETQAAGLTLPAVSVVPGRQLVFEAAGTVLNNTGGNVSTVMKVKLGGAAVLTSSAFTMATAVDPRKWHIKATINIITAGSQRTAADWFYTLSGTETWSAYSAGAVGTSSTAVDLSTGGVVELVATPAVASTSYVLQAQWATLTEVGVPQASGSVGPVSKADIGLGNIDNTSDANKPVSALQQAALDAKLNRAGGSVTGSVTFADANVKFSAGVAAADAELYRAGPAALGTDAALGVGSLLTAYSGIEMYGSAFLHNEPEPATPAGGGRLFVSGGALKYKGSSGTVTVIGPA